MAEFDTGVNNQAEVNMKLAASDAGSKSASEILFNDTSLRDVQTAMAGNDKSSLQEGGFRGFTADDAKLCSQIENTQFAASLVAMSQDRVQQRLTSIQNIG